MVGRQSMHMLQDRMDGCSLFDIYSNIFCALMFILILYMLYSEPAQYILETSEPALVSMNLAALVSVNLAKK